MKTKTKTRQQNNSREKSNRTSKWSAGSERRKRQMAERNVAKLSGIGADLIYLMARRKWIDGGEKCRLNKKKCSPSNHQRQISFIYRLRFLRYLLSLYSRATLVPAVCSRNGLKSNTENRILYSFVFIAIHRCINASPNRWAANRSASRSSRKSLPPRHGSVRLVSAFAGSGKFLVPLPGRA